MSILKRVNISSSTLVNNVFERPFSGEVRNVELTPAKIRLCLVQNARVEEILPDRTVVKLNFTNYDKDNYGKDVVVAEPEASKALEQKNEELQQVEAEVVVDTTKDTEKIEIESEVVVDTVTEEAEEAVEEVAEEAVEESEVAEVAVDTVEQADVTTPQHAAQKQNFNNNRNQKHYKK